jgi:hypothetical protein
MPRRVARVIAVSVLGVVLGASAFGLVNAAIPHSVTKVFVACRASGGTIRIIDHQAGSRCQSTEKTLQWNQRGPAGPPGPAGADGADGSAGADGPQGPAGVSGYEVVTDDFVMTLQAESGTSTVECPTGKVPIGGGYDYSDLFTKNVAPKYENFIGASYPTGTGWAVKWYHGIENLEINFSVYAVCASAS